MDKASMPQLRTILKKIRMSAGSLWHHSISGRCTIALIISNRSVWRLSSCPRQDLATSRY